MSDQGITTPTPTPIDKTTLVGQDFWNEQLLTACKTGSLTQLCTAVSNGANVNCRDSKRKTPLMWVCKRTWPQYIEAVSLARELLARGAEVDCCDADMYMAIHYATLNSNCAMLKLLLDNGSLVDPRDCYGDTPLLNCCNQFIFTVDFNIQIGLSELTVMDELIEMAEVLLNHSANLEIVDNEYMRTPLMDACSYGNAKLVKLFLSRGANVNAVDKYGDTPFLLALTNHMYGLEVIELLAVSGADLNYAHKHGQNAISRAFEKNGNLMRVLAPFYPPSNQLSAFWPRSSCQDPIGSVREASKFGCVPNTNWFSTRIQQKAPAALSWAMLRLTGATTVANMFDAMEQCDDPETWHWVGIEMFNTRDTDDNSTLLHMAARTNNSSAVRELTRIWVNPLLRNKSGQLAVDLTTDTCIREHLLLYTKQVPSIQVMRWYGPYLIRRVRAFLLVLQRWKNTKLRFVSKDVVHVIVGHIRAMEYV